ncbi:hypothetical protein [Alteriqipengyuania lutimaris]|uniref:Uncharacterized protein n=1 Tax=Alteriqipengyuania lutimaris TaxID=1538146 RepID=A0A395LKF7_9SPHN|nr:hypothetical protein [Alteriqipengyuania lutimaris]MBB3033863.1 hypothetical protein [Alteriqipengyuania lutimaris]RDS77169.1 hypothetical protein DL238_05775 [Alteriqipengyuania lutimaris]
MSILVARPVMKLALAGMGSHRCEWAAAMRAEFDMAEEAGEGLSFALGCLATAWRELPWHPEGRLALSRYICAIGLILPTAALLLAGWWCGYPWVEPPYADGIARVASMPRGLATTLYAGNAFALPGLTALLLLRIAGLILVAWFVVDADWDRAGAIQRAGAAATITLTLFSAVALPDLTCVVLPLLAVGVELVSIPLLQRWHEGGDIAEA